MQNLLNRIGVTLSVIAIPLGMAGCPKGSTPTRSRTIVIADATDQLKRTIVVPTADYPIDAETSMIWCATMQIAWRELVEAMGGDVRAVQTNPVISALHVAPDARDDLDDASYVAMAGMGHDGISERIHAEMARKFPSERVTLPPDDIQNHQILAFCYLAKNLRFALPLMQRKTPLPFNGAGEHAAFGLWRESDRTDPDSSARWNQVTVLHYHDRGDWSIEIAHNSPGDRLIIGRSPLEPQLGQTLQRIINQPLNDNAQRLARDERLIVPMIDFDITRQFVEMEGELITGAPALPIEILQAIQQIRFRLDERGAELRSQARIKGEVASEPVRREPRMFVCDGPFFVILMRNDGARPYFAAYIANDELLLPF
ncbi:MAG: hypothetical protein KIT24_03885 [Phycisphaeraceae bacterium]|nr:hypothetical protein [Phycisphaeraceae bacterium]